MQSSPRCSNWHCNTGAAPYYASDALPKPRKSIVFEVRDGHHTWTLIGYYTSWEGGYFIGGPNDEYQYEVRDVARWCYIDLSLGGGEA